MSISTSLTSSTSTIPTISTAQQTSLIIKALGDKKIQITCQNCNSIIYTEFKNFLDDSIELNCPHCNKILNTHLTGLSGIVVSQLITAFDGLEELINELEIFKVG
jgi:Zn finger protein HypA/HybF involved in hydrogenase expression